MTVARIRDLGRAGVNYDLPAHDLPPNALTDLQNVSLRDGAITKSQGWTEAFSVAGDPVWFQNWFDGTNGYALVLTDTGVETKVYELASGSLVDISTATGFGSGLEWDSCVIGNTGVLTNDTDEPYSRVPGDIGDITPMPNWPATWRAPIIRSYRNFLVALKVQKSGVVNETRVQWSNASDVNSVPPDWDELDPASLAGGVTLAGDGGPIIDGLELGQTFMIYCQRKAYSLTLVGGQYVMNIRPAIERGLLKKGCVVAFDGGHFCVGDNVIYVTNGNAVTYMAEDKVQTRFFNELADPLSVHIGHDPRRRVIEVYYKDSRADPSTGFANSVLRWDYSDNSWSFDDVHPVGIAKAAPGPSSDRVVTWANVDTEFNKVDVAWADVEIRWKDLDIATGAVFYHMLVGSATGTSATTKLMRREPITLRDGAEFPTLISREKIDFDQILQAPLATQNIKHVRRILPQITGQGLVYFRFGVAKSANTTTEWGPWIEYDLQDDYKVDFRKSGQYFGWEMQTRVTSPVNFRLSGFDIDVEIAGER